MSTETWGDANNNGLQEVLLGDIKLGRLDYIDSWLMTLIAFITGSDSLVYCLQ